MRMFHNIFLEERKIQANFKIFFLFFIPKWFGDFRATLNKKFKLQQNMVKLRQLPSSHSKVHNGSYPYEQ